MKEHLKEILQNLPTDPGVYMMRDSERQIFYVGKATNLRERVRSYFSGTDTRPFVELLDKILEDVEVVVTATAKEALLLENDLIKTHKPRFNVKLVDDKRYLALRLNTQETFPRLEVVRSFKKDGARYFGPYDSASSIRETLRVVNRYFQLRTCTDRAMANRSRPCLQYQIKRCPAPCVLNEGDDEMQETYSESIRRVTAFLDGKENQLLVELREEMKMQSEQMYYERAAQLRDQISAVERSLERQDIFKADFTSRDIIGIFQSGKALEVHVMRSRESRWVGADRFSLNTIEQTYEDALEEFASRYYAEREDLPNEILLPINLVWAEVLSQHLFENFGKKVKILTPQKGQKRRLVEMAVKNAEQAFIDKKRDQQSKTHTLESLQRKIHLRNFPERIECVDISHHQGEAIVASVVCFEHAKPSKENYRHYAIRTLSGQDDFASMYEIVSRRLKRGLEDGDLPDLLVIDGGKGQLGSVRAALDDCGIGDEIDIIGLAKSRPTKTSSEKTTTQEQPQHSPERIFVSGQKKPIVLKQDSDEIHLLAHVRDEAHRFAITYHRKKKRKSLTASPLDEIKGIGPTRKKALLKHFGSLKRLQNSSFEEISRIVPIKLARKILKMSAKKPKISNNHL